MRIHCSSSCKELLDKLGGYRLEDRGEVEDQNIMIVDDHEKDFDEKRMVFNWRGEVDNGGCFQS